MAIRYCVGSPINSTAAWSTESGGASGASVPTSADNAIFDAMSPSASVGTARTFGTMDFTGYTQTLTMNANITVSGSVTLSATMSLTHSGGILIYQGLAGSLTSNGKAWTGAMQVSGSLAAATFMDAWSIGTLSIGGQGAIVTLSADLTITSSLTLGTTTSATVINGSRLLFTGTAITSTLTTGNVSGTSELVISTACTVGNAAFTTGRILIDQTVDLGVNTVTVNNLWYCDLSKVSVVSGNVIAANTWTTGSGSVYPAVGDVVLGEIYGPTGIEYTGTRISTLAGDLRLGVQVGDPAALTTGTLIAEFSPTPTTRDLSVDWGESGATLFYRVVDSEDNILIPRTSTGVSEFPAVSGLYHVEVTTWDESWTVGRVIWDDGTNHAVEAFFASTAVLDSATQTQLDAIPKAGETHRYTQVASTNTTTDVSIEAIP